MKHLWIYLLATGLLLASGTSWLVASAQFRFVHPRAPQAHFEVTGDGNVVLASADGLQSLIGEGEPKVSVTHTTWDFGVMNLHEVGEHDFEIHNTGTGNLWLKNEGTTCKCTVASLPSGLIPPGESAAIKVRWNSADTGRYAQAATIRTNDPARPIVELRVEGRVSRVCEAEPAELHFPTIGPSEGATSSLLLVSREWNELQLLDARANLRQISWRAVPATREELDAAGAKSALRIVVDLADDIEAGPFLGNLAIVVANGKRPTDKVTIDIPIGGTKLGRYSLFGTGLTEQGHLEIGIVDQGRTHTRRLVLRLRDEKPPAVGDFVVATEPTWLRARLNERSNASNAPGGLYDLVIEIPDDAPQCSYMGVTPATVRIAMPGNGGPSITLQVLFAVMQDR